MSKQRADWSVLVGPEELMAEAVLLGAHGGVNGGANLCPQLYVDLYNAAAQGDLPQVRELQARVLNLGENLYTAGRHRSSGIKGLKCALSLLGVCNDRMAEPFTAFQAPQHELIRERMQALGLL
jgi:4-hydroxy-tetrahydrodipicolinate synthase